MTTQKPQVGRIAFRVEGSKWVARYALPDTQRDALWLGEIAMALVADPIRKKQFMDLMRDAVGDILRKGTGGEPLWHGAKPAPFWETKNDEH